MLQQRNENKNNGFSLIEIIVVLTIIAIMTSVTVPYFTSYIERTKKDVCNLNCLKLENLYGTYLATEYIVHTDTVFAQWMQNSANKICPNHGDINYTNGKVECGKHNSVKVIMKVFRFYD